MNLKQFIVDAINRSSLEVFSTMLGVELAMGTATFEDAKPDINCEVISLIGLAGSWAGSGSLSCSAAFACRVCANMLLTEATAVNEEVLDAMAELTNMIVGNVKTALESKLGPLGLSIPTVVYGRNFKTKTAGPTDWISIHFDWDGDHLLVKLCLAPSDKDAHHRIDLFEEAATLAV
jgi:chemotaxis protein CheX